MAERVEISKKLVLINAASSLATRMLSISVLIWLQQYLLHRITPEEYSLLPVLYSVMMFAPLITTVLTGGLGRFITVAYAKGDDDEVTRICSTMFPLLCFAGFVFLAGGWVLAWHIDMILRIPPERLGDARIMLAILMFSAAARVLVSPFSVGFFVRQRFVQQNIINVCTEIFRLSLLFSLLFGVSTRVLWVITATTIAELLNLTIICAVSLRLVPSLRFRFSHIHWPTAKAITSFGGWSFLLTFANTTRMALDPLLLNRFSTPINVISFHIGALPFNQAQNLMNLARNAVNPALIAMHAEGSHDRLRNVYLRGGRLALWASLLIGVPFFVYADELIALYVGPEFSMAATVMRLQLLVFAIAYGNTMFIHLAEATGLIKEFAWRFLLTNIINLGLTVLFVIVLRFGAIGSALATVAAFAITYPLIMWPAGRAMAKLGLAIWLRETLFPGLLPAGVTLVFLFALSHCIAATTWGILFASCATGAIIYLVCLYFFAARESDKQDMSSFVNYIKGGSKQAECLDP